MKNKICQLISEKPKHFSKMVKNSPEMTRWVMKNTLVTSNNFAEVIYSAVYQVGNMCNNGKIKKFNSISKGYRGCGSASQCLCVAKLVSSKVKATKLLVSEDEKNKSNQKRKETSLTIYGVSNNAQTYLAKENHRKYYQAQPKKVKIKPLSTYQKLNKKYLELSNIRFATPEDQYLGVSNHEHYQFECLTCSSTFSDYIDNGHLPICKTCNPFEPTYVSKQEIEVYQFLKSISPYEVKQTDKSIINPYELDIVIPDLKLAIEYCGLYWHSEIHKTDRNYHISKAKKCNDKGYRLITIFEDEWTQRSEIVKNRLTSLVGIAPKIHGRKCIVMPIASNVAAKFNEQYHLQGNSIFKIAYGCFSQNQLVAVMTFGKPRYDKKIEYELIRYCSIGNIVGGAGKLFSRFIKDYAPTSVVSYCDMRWGTGNLYSQLRFVDVTGHLKPSYAYTNFLTRFHRSNYTKKRLLADGGTNDKTESQMMKERKMYKIWDCGQSKWVWTLHKDDEDERNSARKDT
jgi:hypothetical protein